MAELLVDKLSVLSVDYESWSVPRSPRNLPPPHNQPPPKKQQQSKVTLAAADPQVQFL